MFQDQPRLRRTILMGMPLLPCISLGLSSMFTFHASPLGSAGILLFFIAVLGFDHATSPAGAYVEYRARPLHRRLWRKT